MRKVCRLPTGEISRDRAARNDVGIYDHKSCILVVGVCALAEIFQDACIFCSKMETTVGLLILRIHFLQIALKLLNTLLCNFAAGNHIEIVRSGYNQMSQF